MLLLFYIYIWCQYHKYSHIFAWFAVTDKSICFKEEAAQKQEEVSEVGQMTKEFGTGAAEIIQAEIVAAKGKLLSY